MNFQQILVSFLGLVATATALECYVCQEQPDNRDKCTKTTIQCRQNQNACMTRIKWIQPFYWLPRSERIYSIYKECDMIDRCENEQKTLGLRCMRNWYRDWECVECCRGDRCNYYVTLGAASTKFNIFLTLLATVTVHLILKLRS
ncbi:hypothetical protein ACJMK2_013262 [Sinanodonta woodiana]|uniref:Snake toxin/toxin-like domain-containing protein n=1 Tax=Sinanodonta woodiana TaxID=1069815 RepID=A0ABD3V087_SINWO